MAATIELVWSVNGLRAPGMKSLYYAFTILFNGADLVLFLAMTPSVFVRWSILGLVPLLGGYNLVQSSVSLWVLLVRRQNSLLAITIIATSASAMLEVFGVFAGGITIGPFYMEHIGLAFLLSEVALLLLLSQRAIKAWRSRDELRVEFDAARDVQQQLVAPAVDLPGFQIQSAYAPAKQVGGDFFRVLPEADGSVLIVMGDVSGKGLKAAMTVSAIMGALPGCRSRKPSEVLAHLNECSLWSDRRLRHLLRRPHLPRRHNDDRQRRQPRSLSQWLRNARRSRPAPRPAGRCHLRVRPTISSPPTTASPLSPTASSKLPTHKANSTASSALPGSAPNPPKK